MFMPPEFPDANPIENIWQELKEYIRQEVKPKMKQELITGIESFWETVAKEKCIKYIRHLRKVVPKIIDVNGAATGYGNDVIAFLLIVKIMWTSWYLGII